AIKVFNAALVALCLVDVLRGLLYLGVDLGEIEGGPDLSGADTIPLFDINTRADAADLKGKTGLGIRGDQSGILENTTLVAKDHRLCFHRDGFLGRRINGGLILAASHQAEGDDRREGEANMCSKSADGKIPDFEQSANDCPSDDPRPAAQV